MRWQKFGMSLNDLDFHSRSRKPRLEHSFSHKFLSQSWKNTFMCFCGMLTWTSIRVSWVWWDLPLNSTVWNQFEWPYPPFKVTGAWERQNFSTHFLPKFSAVFSFLCYWDMLICKLSHFLHLRQFFFKRDHFISVNQFKEKIYALVHVEIFMNQLLWNWECSSTYR